MVENGQRLLFKPLRGADEHGQDVRGNPNASLLAGFLKPIAAIQHHNGVQGTTMLLKILYLLKQHGLAMFVSASFTDRQGKDVFLNPLLAESSLHQGQPPVGQTVHLQFVLLPVAEDAWTCASFFSQEGEDLANRLGLIADDAGDLV